MIDTINGYPIIGAWVTPKAPCYDAGRIVVVDRGQDHEERYVVAWVRDGSSGWTASTYHRAAVEAAQEFARRIEREVR